MLTKGLRVGEKICKPASVGCRGNKRQIRWGLGCRHRHSRLRASSFTENSGDIVMRIWKHIAFTMALIAAGPVAAATIVDTGNGAVGVLDGYTLNQDQSLAARFTVAAPVRITGANGWIGAYQSSTLTISLFAGGGQTPGALLYSASTPVVVTGRENATWRGLGGQSWLIAPGTYFVGFSSSALLTMVQDAPHPLADEAYFNSSNGYWVENDSLNLGVQVFGEAVAASGAVPEPATWAMMLTGFGVVGFGLRRRSNRPVRVAYA